MRSTEELVSLFKPPTQQWKVLVVDDDPDAHEIMRMALQNATFFGADIDYLHAHSFLEASKIIDETADIAVLLLDIAMEHEQSGLDVAEYLRDHKVNGLARIILVTGGIDETKSKALAELYDLDGFVEKQALTRSRLHIAVRAAIRTYRALVTAHNNAP